jgi:putative GTP pyrophosphokinase
MAKSRTQVDKAGDFLRHYVSGPDAAFDEEQVEAALLTVEEYRQSFTAASEAVAARLAPMVDDTASGAQLVGRPKRFGAVIMKLIRLRTIRLTQIEDIAGLRVKFPNGPQEVQALLRRILDEWPDAVVIDYVAKPKATGYRAIHVVLAEDDRWVEVQLRTVRQNRWADEVEAAADRLDFRLKDGIGPDELVRYFERASLKLALEEQGVTVDEHFTKEFEDLRRQVRPYFASSA